MGVFLSGTASPATDLSANYQSALTGAWWGSGGASTVTLNGLTDNHIYLFQIWVDDSRGCCGWGRSADVTLGAITVTLDFNSTDAVGGVGQYAIGTFVASGGSRVITLGGATPQINAIQVRDLGVSAPPPSVISEPNIDASGFSFSFSGPNGQPYTVLSTTNVALPLSQWQTDSSGVLAGSGSPIVFTNATPTAETKRFYRVRSP